ncbi:MAG: 16S rRNA (cytosine(967)-C(5))-methyltransferase RsmB [Oleibacter sp.]|nr:16S rRNA (cytosine(967)-C(5))-methyltransferase RsmB [Thalassolituus sp.]
MSESPWGQRNNTPTELSARLAAARALAAVLDGQSATQAIANVEDLVEGNDLGFMRDLVLGSCRWYFRLNALAKMLLKHPFSEDEQDLHALLVIGLYQLVVQGKAPHAAVHATVDVCDEMGKQYAKSVINACLRRYGREYETLLPPLNDNPVTATSHPKWLVKMLTKAWPEQWSDILRENNERAPLCLRVNRRQIRRDDYLNVLNEAGIAAWAGEYSADAIYLNEACDVTSLPGFEQGQFSVQDEAPQMAAQLLAPQSGERILDACTAPGGKACHVLECADVELTAIDADEHRLQRVYENLQRLQLKADVRCADLAEPDATLDAAFDAILLDVPCSATGVIRRHPDIRLLRRREDIEALQGLQQRILHNCWRMLKPGGRLLYATCSVLPQENSDQVRSFVASQEDASVQGIDGEFGQATDVGRQLLPKHDSHDGFFYALLHKAAH